MSLSRPSAFHHAAQAVAAARLGFVFDHEVGPDIRVKAWSALINEDQPWPRPMQAMVMLAGSIAEARAASTSAVKSRKQSAARNSPLSADLHLTEAELGELSQETSLLVEQQWTAIEGVATQLLSGRTLTFDQIASFVLWPRGS